MRRGALILVWLWAAAGCGRPQPLRDGRMDCTDPVPLAGGVTVFSCSERGKPWAIYTASRQDPVPRRLSFAPFSMTDPRPLPDGRLLVRAGQDFYTMNPDGTWPEKVAGPVPAAASRTPKGRPSEVDLTRRTGTLLCYAAGRAARVEFLSRTRSLGSYPVEPDGSFLVEVPADLALRLRTLDRRGRVIKTGGWFWLRPGETRSCAGCHEPATRMAENRLVRALERRP